MQSIALDKCLSVCETISMETPYKCPECAGSLILDDSAEMDSHVYRQAPCMVSYVEVVRRPAIVAFCESCEFSLEVRP